MNKSSTLAPKKVDDLIAAGMELNISSSTATGLVVGCQPHQTFGANENILQLQAMLRKVLKKKQYYNQKYLDKNSDPAAQPMVWVSKWVGIHKYGFGYQLSNEAVCVHFNDATKLIILPNGMNVQYLDHNGEESYMTLNNYPMQHHKKMTLVTDFNRYMHENLAKTGPSVCKDSISRTPLLHQLSGGEYDVLMQLNNGTVQMDFCDHTKIIMCPLMASITYVGEDKLFKTFRFSTIEKNGCSLGLFKKMQYAYNKMTPLLKRN